MQRHKYSGAKTTDPVCCDSESGPHFVADAATRDDSGALSIFDILLDPQLFPSLRPAYLHMFSDRCEAHARNFSRVLLSQEI